MTAVAIIGYGEVGALFTRDLLHGGATKVSVFDIADQARSIARAAPDIDVHDTPSDAVRGADIVFVCVTAASTLAAARSIAGALARAPLVVDINSVSPATKRAAAAIISGGGGRFVEAAVMASVAPRGLRTPMLLGGDHAEDFLSAMRNFELNAHPFDREIGRAAAVKMCRSVMVKGLEALAAECLLAARHYGVADEVFRSLTETLPHPDWAAQARYLVERSVRHGLRRAEEMREVSDTVAAAGVDPWMSRATVERQHWAAGRVGLLDPVTSPDPPSENRG